MKVYDPGELAADGADVLKTKSFRSREVPGMSLTVQVAPDDCTGCGLCVTACPAHDKSEVKRKSINLRPDRGAPRRRASRVGRLPAGFTRPIPRSGIRRR